MDIGTLMVSNTTGSATGAGRVVVKDTLIGNGTIAPSAGNGLTMLGSPSGSFLILDSQFGTPGNLKVGSAGVNNPVTLLAGSNFVTRVNGTTFDPNGGDTSYGRLTVRGTGAITINGSVLTVGLALNFTPSASDVFGILDNQTTNSVTGTFAGVGQDGTVKPRSLRITRPRGRFRSATTATSPVVGSASTVEMTLFSTTSRRCRNRFPFSRWGRRRSDSSG